MGEKLTAKQILATFVLAFLCLNAGGFLCITYCSQTSMASVRPASDDSHLSEHCRLAKIAAEEKNQNAEKISANVASCCMMPISLFAAPLEKHERAADLVAADSVPAVVTEFCRFEFPPVVLSHISATPVYRPPPLDRRVERILHSVFRI